MRKYIWIAICETIYWTSFAIGLIGICLWNLLLGFVSLIGKILGLGWGIFCDVSHPIFWMYAELKTVMRNIVFVQLFGMEPREPYEMFDIWEWTDSWLDIEDDEEED